MSTVSSGDARFLHGIDHSAQAGVQKRDVAVVLGHRLLPPRPLLVLQVPLPVLAQVGRWLAHERLLEVGPRRDRRRIVPGCKRLRHDVGEVGRRTVDAQEERLLARRPLAHERDTLIGAAPRVRSLFGGVEHPAHRLPPARKVDVRHRLPLPLTHRLGGHVTVKTECLRAALLVDVPLADVVERVAARPQETGKGGDLLGQPRAPSRRYVGVDHHAVVVGIQPGEQRRPRRRAHRRGGVGEVERGSLAGQPVQIGGFADPVSVAPQGVLAELVGEEEDDVEAVHACRSILPVGVCRVAQTGFQPRASALLGGLGPLGEAEKEVGQLGSWRRRAASGQRSTTAVQDDPMLTAMRIMH